MPHKHKLSLPAAIMINVNIMLGAGIFINTTALAQRAGALGALGYLIVGMLMLPMIISIAQLVRMHPAGGFYVFGQKELHPFAGFLSSWSYFVAKLASATLMLHTSVLLLQTIIPTLTPFNPLLIDGGILALFAMLNMRAIKTGSNVQALFMALKIIPIIFAIVLGFWFFDGAHINAMHHLWSGIPSTLSLVLYACIGFEAAVSLSSRIENAEQNAPRAILISYGIVVAIAALYQLFFYSALGSTLSALPNFLHAFPALLGIAGLNLATWQTFLHLAIASSALGGAYGIMFSNSWNLLTLAEHNHLLGSNFFKTLNKHEIPWLCVAAEALIIIAYLIITGGEKLLLQQISALGVVFAYFVSVLALVRAKYTNPELGITSTIPLLGLGNAMLLMGMCVYGLMSAGAHSLIAFLVLFGTGAGMYFTAASDQ